MIGSILIGFLTGITLYLAGWLRVLFSLISFSMGERVPFLYLFLGINLGMGITESYFWAKFISGLITSIYIATIAYKYSQKSGLGFSTVSTCSSFFIVGSFIGLIFDFIKAIIN